MANLGINRRAVLGRTRGLGLLGGRAGLIIVAGVPLAFAVVLIAITFQTAFRPAEGDYYTLDQFRFIYTNAVVMKMLLNTAVFGGIAVVVALMFALPSAWLTERTDLPARGLIFPLMTMSVIVPGFFTAMGWLFLLHPRIGILNIWITQIFSIDKSPISITTLVGMGIVEGIGLSSLAFIMLAGAFRAQDPALEESAQLHGLGLLRRMQTVTLPLVWPAILSTSLYVVTIALAAFDTPAIIGLSARIFTFSTWVRLQTSPDASSPNYGLTAAGSMIMIVVAVGISIWYMRVVSRSHKYAVVRGQNYRPKPVELGRWWILGWSFLGFKLLLTFIMPVTILVWASLIPFLEPPSMAALQKVSLDNYRSIPWDAFWVAARHTLILVVTVPTLTIIFGVAVSWIVTRSRMRVAWAFDLLAFLPHAIPNIIFAVGAIIIALFWVPDFIPFYGTIYILIVVYVITRISFATRIYNSSLLQIHRELDEAGNVFGLNTVLVIWHILRPLMAPVLLYTWVWMALLVYRELTIAVLLTTPNNITVPVYIFGLFQNNFAMAAAASVVLMLGILPLVLLYFAVGRRRLDLVR